MEVLIVAATPFEIAPLTEYLNKFYENRGEGVFAGKNRTVRVLVSGVGIAATSWQLGLLFARTKPGLAVNAGIAGAFDRNFQLGEVLHVVTERFGDLGVEEADGSFTDLLELGLADGAKDLYVNGKLQNPAAAQTAFLPLAHGLTVNKVHGAAGSVASIRKKYPDAQVESMEGAAFFQACLFAGVPFLEIRSISNYVEPRNREAWDLPLAIGNLNKVLIELLEAM